MWIIWLLMDAIVLGVIIAAMEEGDFPDLWRVIVCAFGTALAAVGIATVLGSVAGQLGVWVSLFFGALVGGLLISALCSMSVKRASIAAGVFLGYKVTFLLVTEYLLTS
jgi:hypothetical protein